MTKNAFASLVGAVCTLSFCSSASFGQNLTGTSLSISGTGTINTLVSGTASIGLLEVTGTADFQDNTWLFGSAGTNPGISFVYSDGTSGTNSGFSQTATRPLMSWTWQRVVASGTSTSTAMKLDDSNRLILTGTAASNPPQLVLDPNGAISVGGSNFLTQADANALYLSATAGLFATGSNVGIGTTAPGAQLQVNASAPTAIGQIVKAAASQTADLQQWQDSSGNVLIKNKVDLNSSSIALSYAGYPTQYSYITSALDEMYPSSALYITNLNSRIYFGKNGQDLYAVNFSHVTTLEKVPPMVGLRGSAGNSTDGTVVASIGGVDGNVSGLALLAGSAGSYISAWRGNPLYGARGMKFMTYLLDADIFSSVDRAGFVFTTKGTSLTLTKPHTIWGTDTAANTLMSLSMLGTLTQTVGSASTIGHIIRGYAGQTADLQQWQNSAGTGLSAVNKDGWFGIGTTAPAATLDVKGSAKISGNLAISGTGSLALPDGTVLSASNTLSHAMASGTAAYALASTTAASLSGAIQATQVNGLAAIATTGAFSSLQGCPTTLAGYGITDSVLLATGAYADPSWLTSLAYTKLTGVPTNVSAFTNDAGYITASGTASMLTVSGTITISGQTNISGSTKFFGGVVVTGSAVEVTSGTSITTKIVSSGTNQLVLIPEQGDLSMGDFTNGVRPQ